MASDILLGWLLGMATIGGPLIYLKIRELKSQIAFLRGNGEMMGPQKDADFEPQEKLR